ncbi:MAG: hypothetical protein ACJAR2_003150 [Ilumatobacter sp.]
MAVGSDEIEGLDRSNNNVDTACPSASAWCNLGIPTNPSLLTLASMILVISAEAGPESLKTRIRLNSEICLAAADPYPVAGSITDDTFSNGSVTNIFPEDQVRSVQGATTWVWEPSQRYEPGSFQRRASPLPGWGADTPKRVGSNVRTDEDA